MDITAIIKENLPDGVELSDKQIKAISKEISTAQGLEFIPKESYNKKVEKLNELETEVKELKGSTAEIETYKTKVATLEEEYKNYKATIENEKTASTKTSALTKALKDSGANEKAIKLLLKEFDLAKVELDGDNIKKADELINPVKESYADFFGKVETKGVDTGNPLNGDAKLSTGNAMNDFIIRGAGK